MVAAGDLRGRTGSRRHRRDVELAENSEDVIDWRLVHQTGSCAVVSYVGACAPDLVIHLGDLSLDGAGNAADLRHGRIQLDRLPVAWHAVPGNH